MRKLLTFLFLTKQLLCLGQSLQGNWSGKLTVGEKSVEIVFRINNQNSVTAFLDVPIQKAYNVKADEVTISKNKLLIGIKAVSLKFEATIVSETLISGKWIQGGLTIPLELKRTGNFSDNKSYKRPQTPIPPFPYQVIDVSFSNADKSIHFGGTLTLPNSKSASNDKFPAVVLISGTGKQDRDATMFEHKPFALLADYLTKLGIAVLRVDERESGVTTGDFFNSTTLDFSNDTESALDFLKLRNDIDTTNLGLLGHSEGGLIAAMVASRRKDIKFVCLLASPGLKPTDLLTQQSIDLLRAQGIGSHKLDEMKPMFANLIKAIIETSDTVSARVACEKIFNKWRLDASRSVVRSTTGVKDDASMDEYIDKLIKTLNTPWHRYYMRSNPEDFISQLSCYVLALNGERDVQVSSKDNLSAIKRYLNNSKVKGYDVYELQGLNHLFQHCRKCSYNEYGEIEETFANEALLLIGDWIRKIINVKP